MRRRLLRISLIAGCAVCVGWFVLRWWMGRVVPVEDNPFVAEVGISLVDADSKLVTEDLLIPSARGRYVQIELTKKAEWPLTSHEQEVQTPDRWPVSVALIPRTDVWRKPFIFDSMATHRIKLPPRSEAGLGPLPFIPPVGLRYNWISKFGYHGAPELPATSETSNVYWTFLVDPQADGTDREYIYEIRLHPTCRWVSSFRADRGTPIVLRRGLLRVTADASGG